MKKQQKAKPETVKEKAPAANTEGVAKIEEAIAMMGNLIQGAGEVADRQAVLDKLNEALAELKS